MTQPGSDQLDPRLLRIAAAAAEQTRTFGELIARPTSAERPSATEMARRAGVLTAELSVLLRRGRMALSPVPEFPKPARVPFDPKRLISVERTWQADRDREALLIGGLMTAPREVAEKLLRLVDSRYLLSLPNVITWHHARNVRFKDRAVPHPKTLRKVDGGLNENQLTALCREFEKKQEQGEMDVDTLIDTGKKAAGIGLHRHALVAANQIAFMVRSPRGDDLDWLRVPRDVAHTLRTCAEHIKKVAELIDTPPEVGSAERRPLSVAVQAIHDQQAQSGKASGEADTADTPDAAPATVTGDMRKQGKRKRS